MTKPPSTTRETGDERKQRLAEALRANLQKRKTQTRQRREQQPASETEKQDPSECDR